jgi:hypothetical protein
VARNENRLSPASRRQSVWHALREAGSVRMSGGPPQVYGRRMGIRP